METKVTCTRHAKVRDPFLQQTLWEIYLEELGPAMKKETAFPQQCFGEFKMFLQVLLDQEFRKFVLFSKEGQKEQKVCGLAISCSNLEKVRDIAGVKFNPEFYRERLPGKIIHYFPAMCILKPYQKKGFLHVLGKEMIESVTADNGVAAFDFSETKNAALSQIILYLTKRSGLRPDAKETILDRQVFAVVG